jgi:hypothetical protein
MKKRRKTGKKKYKIMRYSFKGSPRTIKRGVTLAQAKAHCKSPKTHNPTGSNPWFDGFTEE